jgi:hypothetical protein
MVGDMVDDETRLVSISADTRRWSDTWETIGIGHTKQQHCRLASMLLIA